MILTNAHLAAADATHFLAQNGAPSIWLGVILGNQLSPSPRLASVVTWTPLGQRWSIRRVVQDRIAVHLLPHLLMRLLPYFRCTPLHARTQKNLDRLSR